MRAEESRRFTDRPLRLLRGKNNSVHIKKSKRTNRAARPGKTKVYCMEEQNQRKKREKKKQHELLHRQHHCGQVMSSSSQQQEGQKVVFIQHCVIFTTYCRVVKSAADSYRGAESTRQRKWISGSASQRRFPDSKPRR